LTGNWIRESHFTDNNNVSPWPTGYNGEVRENPRVRTLQLTSTLSPSLLNEARYGYRVTTLVFAAAVHSNHAQEASDFLTKINGYPVYQRPALFTNNVIGPSGDLGNKSPLNTFTDTLTWTKGAHAPGRSRRPGRSREKLPSAGDVKNDTAGL